MSFQSEANKPRSEKVLLVTMEADGLAIIFQDEGSGLFSRDVPLFVSAVRSNGVSITKVNSTPTLNNTFFYNIQEKKLYLKLDGSNPATKDISIRYKFFFSTAPVILPHDLGSGEDIEWEARIESVGSLGQRLDDENTGIVLESNSSVSIINNDGFLDDYFDTLLWENKQAKFFSWFPGTSITDVVQVFDGVISSKDFGDTVTFQLKDFIFRLRDTMSMPVFNELDATGVGSVQESFIGKPKRRIYGKVNGLRCVPVDVVGRGYFLDETASIVNGSNLCVFSGPVLNKLSIGDEIIVSDEDNEVKFAFDNGTLNLAGTAINQNVIEIEDPKITIATGSVFVIPKIGNSGTNRRFNVCGHKCYDIFLNITSVVSSNRFEVSNTDNLLSGDLIIVGTTPTSVLRISGNVIVTTSTISPVPNIGDLILRPSVQDVYYGPKRLVFQRDWSYDNEIDNNEIIIEEDAEFNVSDQRSFDFNLTFTNNSPIITTTVDPTSVIKPGDYIRKNSLTTGQGEWYKVFSVFSDTIFLYTAYLGSTATTSAKYKNVEYISDDSIITCTVYGMDDGEKWCRTPAQSVRDIMLRDALFPSVDEDSFLESNNSCDYTLSLAVPEYGGSIPKIKDVVTKINESVFGSLYGNSSSAIKYSILNAEKPLEYYDLKDDDILSFGADTITDIYNNIRIRFSHYTDKSNGDNTALVTEYNSGFVDNYTQIANTLEKDCYLYYEEEARTIAQRFALFKSMPSTRLTIKSKMNLFLAAVNDKVGVTFDRLFKRFSGGDRLRFGIISGVKRLPTETEIVVNDIGGIFNRVPAIASDDANDYSSSTSSERLRWGYIVDNDTLTPDAASEDNLGSNIIG